MKKLTLLVLLPTVVLANPHTCELWEPSTICTEDGGIQPSYAASLYAEDPPHWITHQFPFTVPVEGGYVNWLDLVATSIDPITHEHSYTPAGQCSQTCTEVLECDFGEIIGPDGVCIEDVTNGPYLCGLWTGSASCHPETGAIVEAYELAMFEEGFWLHQIVDGPDLIRWDFVNQYKSFEYRNNLGNIIVENCNRHCPRVSNGHCPDSWETDDIGICLDPAITPVEEPTPWDIQADDVSYVGWYQAFLGAGQQARRDGGTTINYMSFVYRNPADNQYRYTGLFQVTNLQATLDWVTTSGYIPVGYIIVHPVMGYVTYGPRYYDQQMKLEVEALNPSINYYAVYTQTNSLVFY